MLHIPRWESRDNRVLEGAARVFSEHCWLSGRVPPTRGSTGISAKRFLILSSPVVPGGLFRVSLTLDQTITEELRALTRLVEKADPSSSKLPCGSLRETWAKGLQSTQPHLKDGSAYCQNRPTDPRNPLMDFDPTANSLTVRHIRRPEAGVRRCE